MNNLKNDSQRNGHVLKLLCALIMVMIMAAGMLLTGCGGSSGESENGNGEEEGSKQTQSIERDGTYDQKDDVRDYLVEYGELPANYITKNEARDLGWNGGSVEQYAPGKCIGGDRFGNYEKKLPKSDDRDYYHECDIDTLGKDSRGAKRIIYSKDGDIYYTEDHYGTFEKIDGE